jgi:hypothetical protein
MEYLAQALATLPIADRLSIIEEAITSLHTDYLESVQALIEKQSITVPQE